MILIEAGSQGGSIEAGRECLGLHLPLFAAVYDATPEAPEGNRQLLEQGARPPFRSRSTGRASLGPVYQTLQNDPIPNAGSQGPQTGAIHSTSD